jgi:hypothetical protein
MAAVGAVPAAAVISFLPQSADIPKYYEGDNAERFVNKFNLLAQATGWNNPSQVKVKLSMFKLYLQDRVREHMEKYQNDWIADPVNAANNANETAIATAVYAEFLRYYQPTTTEQALRASQLSSIAQTPTQTVQDYYAVFTEHFKNLPTTHKTIQVALFIKGLKPNIRTYMQSSGATFDTLMLAYQQAKNYETKIAIGELPQSLNPVVGNELVSNEFKQWTVDFKNELLNELKPSKNNKHYKSTTRIKKEREVVDESSDDEDEMKDDKWRDINKQMNYFNKNIKNLNRQLNNNNNNNSSRNNKFSNNKRKNYDSSYGNYGNRNNNHNHNQQIGKCTYCGKPGHDEENCWDKYPNKKPNASRPNKQ